MRSLKSLTPVIAASVMTVSGLTATNIAQAEVSSDLTISSMYLWRGLDISDGKPAVSSTVQYDDASGFFVGSWFSSEGMPAYTTSFSADTTGDGSFDTAGDIAIDGTNGTSYEVDLYLGYSGKVEDFGYTVGYYMYLYPEAAGSISDSDIKEYMLGASYKDFSFSAYINAESSDSDSYKYYSFDYTLDKIGLHYGLTSVDKGDGYNDIKISYALTDALSWSLSKASGDAIESNGPQSDPLIMVSYSVPLK